MFVLTACVQKFDKCLYRLCSKGSVCLGTMDVKKQKQGKNLEVLNITLKYNYCTLRWHSVRSFESSVASLFWNNLNLGGNLQCVIDSISIIDSMPITMKLNLLTRVFMKRLTGISLTWSDTNFVRADWGNLCQFKIFILNSVSYSDIWLESN